MLADTPGEPHLGWLTTGLTAGLTSGLTLGSLWAHSGLNPVNEPNNEPSAHEVNLQAAVRLMSDSHKTSSYGHGPTHGKQGPHPVPRLPCPTNLQLGRRLAAGEIRQTTDVEIKNGALPLMGGQTLQVGNPRRRTEMRTLDRQHHHSNINTTPHSLQCGTAAASVQKPVCIILGEQPPTMVDKNCGCIALSTMLG